MEPPNPSAPEAWLPPEEARADRILQSSILGLLAVSIWELLQEFPNDLKVISMGKFTVQKVAFILTRFSGVAFILTSALPLMTKEFLHCHRWHMATSLVYAVAHGSAGLLFYFRVAAVFRRKRRVVWFFRVAWLLMVAGNLILAFTIDKSPIYPIRYCVTVVTSRLTIAIAMIQGTYDTLVCAAITYGLSIGEGEPTFNWRELFRFRRKTFSQLRQRFLKDSQFYFLVTASSKLPETIVFLKYYTQKSETSLQFIVAYPDTLIVTVLAAKIYRKLKLGQPGLLSGESKLGTSMIILSNHTDTQDSAEPHAYPPAVTSKPEPS